MIYPEGTPEYALRKTADKYGLSMLFLIINYLVISIGVQLIIANTLIILTGSARIDSSSDAGYAFLLLENSVLGYAAPMIVFAAMFRKDRAELKNTLQPYEKINGELVLLFLAGGCIARLGALITTFVSSLFNFLYNIPMPETAFSDMMSKSVTQFLLFEFFSVIVAPLCEEYIYRHLLLVPMRRFGDMQAALISSLIFGLGHFNFDQFLYTFLFGFSLAIVTIRRNSVIPAIVIHALNNLIAGLSVYLPETFGNETADRIFAVISDLCGYIGWGLIIFGLLSALISLRLKLFRTRTPYWIPDNVQRKIIFTDPMVIAGAAGSLLLTFWLLYV